LVQSLAQLANQLLATGAAEVAVAAEALPQGVQLLQILWSQSPGRIRQRTPHKPTEGVCTALKIAKAAISFQLSCPLQELAPGSQAWWGGFSWLS
jgi:hypothetical protein